MMDIALSVRISMALKGILGVMKRPKYIVMSLTFALAFALLIYFFINIGVYGAFLSSSLPFFSKMYTIWLMAVALVGDMTTANGKLLLAVAILQGISFTFIVFTIRRNKKMSIQALGGGGIATIAATLGLGCVPCGTSIILPVASIFFSSSVYAVANTASIVVLIVAFMASIYSLYRLGFISYAYVASDALEGVGR